MHDDRVLVEKRIERELWERVLPQMHPLTVPMVVEAWHAPGEPVPYEVAVRQDFEPFRVGDSWSRPWGTTWFRLTSEVPAAWANERIEAVIDLGFHHAGAGFQAEGLVWDDGVPLQGVHPRRTAVPLSSGGDRGCVLLVEAASNPSLGAGFQPSTMGSLETAGDRGLYRLRRADLAVRDDDVFHLLLDAEVALGVMRGLALADPRRAHLLRAIEAALNEVNDRDVAGTAARARSRLADALAAPARASSLTVIGVGHAHIDSAWLWPIRETVRKCARTFASAVRLMDDYPDYRFVGSQAAQYDWIEQRYPATFEQITDKVAGGQFIPVGGMWVEADMNLPSGESLVRQLVHGQRYFESRFGLRCQEAWLPDVFGYPASLPQIFTSGGCDRFVTQKLSWNKQNRFPHNTFWWEGVDGTRVLTHFPPVDTYNAEVTGEEMAFSEVNFQDHGWSRFALMPFGYGNGGGGPTREMVERARRLADLDGAPRLRLGAPDDFFGLIEAEAASCANVPVWRGELYFEMHRGTLTSQIETKVGNRRCERLLREAELWWAAGGAVPREVADELDSLWKAVLVQQFHDILPGSSIAWVHHEAEAEHVRVSARLESLIAGAFQRLGVVGYVIANATTHPRREVMVSTAEPDGVGYSQRLSTGETASLVEVPGSGLVGLTAIEATDRIVTTEHSMANGHLAVHWDLDGTITSIIDVARGRELLAVGTAVTVELAPDHPVEYDAWDLESWTRQLGVPLEGVPMVGAASVEYVERGPLLSSVCVRRTFADSVMDVTYVMRAGSARLDLCFDIEWHEHERLLSVVVPLDVHAADATCDIQFATVRRPTHASTPWDAAKFEVCAHRFVDLSEPNFGVAVLNDGRFGHCLFDGGVRVSLLRGARFPDPEADQGRHRVTISVMPHGAGLHDVLHEAEALNMPLRLVPGGPDLAGSGLAAAARFVPPVVSVDHQGVQLSAVKRADDGSGDLIVRLHEACGDRAAVSVRAATSVLAAHRCNALEEPHTGLDVADGFVALILRPFELVTLRLAT